MALGPSTYLVDAWLDATFNGVSFSVTTPYIQLHTGDPGGAGTANVAGNATRKAVSWALSSSGSVTTDADIAWTDPEVDTSEDYTHFALFDAASAGNFLGSGTVTANAVDASGDTFTIGTGGATIDMSSGVAA